MAFFHDSNASSPSSLRYKLRQSLSLPSCFGRHHHPLRSPQLSSDDNPTLIWVDTKAAPHDHTLSELKDKCCAIFGITGVKHRRHSSAEFSYDPLSYARNFEDGVEFDDEAPLRNFSARLPPSLPLSAAVS